MISSDEEDQQQHTPEKVRNPHIAPNPDESLQNSQSLSSPSEYESSDDEEEEDDSTSDSEFGSDNEGGQCGQDCEESSDEEGSDEEGEDSDSEQGWEWEWDNQLALNYLAKSTMGPFNIKKQRLRTERGVEGHDRRRERHLKDKWPHLESQMKALTAHMLLEFDPKRARASSVAACVLDKMEVTIRTYMSYCERAKDEEVRLEMLLCGDHLLSWMKYCLIKRCITYSTLATYITSLLQALDAIQAKVSPCMSPCNNPCTPGLQLLPHALQEPEMHSSDAIHELIAHLKTYRKQLQQKSKKQSQHTLMTQTLHIRDTLEHGSPQEIENLPGSLKYAMAKEWAREEGEAWLRVGGKAHACRVPHAAFHATPPTQSSHDLECRWQPSSHVESGQSNMAKHHLQGKQAWLWWLEASSPHGSRRCSSALTCPPSGCPCSSP